MIRQRDDRADFIVQFYWYCSQYQNFYLLENVVWFLEPYIQKTSFSLLEEWKMRFSCKKVCPSIFQHPLRGSKLLLASGRKTDAETRVARYPMTNPSIAIHIYLGRCEAISYSFFLRNPICFSTSFSFLLSKATGCPSWAKTPPMA